MQPAEVDDILTELESYLVAITGRILQTSNRKAGIALGAATNAVTGSTVYAGIMGSIGLFGTASTGTAIAGLFGAAKTSASLFWLGGLVGGGVATGGAILAVGTIAAGIYSSSKVRNSLLGRSRHVSELSEHETRALGAILALKSAIETQRNSKKSPSLKEIVLFNRIGVRPLVDELFAFLDAGVFQKLTLYNRARLRGHLNNLRSYQNNLERR